MAVDQLFHCPDCNHRVPQSEMDASGVCKKCAKAATVTANNNAVQQSLRALIAVALVLGSIWYFYGGGVEQQVAQDQIKQYEIAKRSGTAIDAAASAGVVAAVYLQAHDEENYRKWKSIEEEEMRRASH
jgi:hypothetical protein